MPMDFPDLAKLRRSFDYPEMLPYQDGETEDTYRERCAAWSEQQGDHVQAQEVRTKKGWDKWNDFDKLDGLRRIARTKSEGGTR